LTHSYVTPIQPEKPRLAVLKWIGLGLKKFGRPFVMKTRPILFLL